MNSIDYFLTYKVHAKHAFLQKFPTMKKYTEHTNSMCNQFSIQIDCDKVKQ